MKATSLIVIIFLMSGELRNSSVPCKINNLDSKYKNHIKTLSLPVDTNNSANIESDTVSNSHNTYISQLLDSLTKVSTNENLERFEIKKSSSFYGSDKIELDSILLRHLYNTEELQRIYGYYPVESFYHGTLNGPKGYKRFFVYNDAGFIVKYISCFILDSNYVVKDMFFPAFIELDPSFSYIKSGRFKSDSIFEQIDYSQRAIDMSGSKFEVDSTIIRIRINNNGKTEREVIFSFNDTINEIKNY